MVFPALANIDAENDSPTCDESVLNASNGTANLEINWEPNVIPLRWYSGNTLLEPENNDDTCTYDGVLNRPTNPTREGYNFAGWRVRPTMDFSTIPTNVNGPECWSKGWVGNANYCYYGAAGGNQQNVACNSDITYTELQTYEWKIRFNHGDLYGMAKCSTEGEGLNQGMVGNSTINNTAGQYCWCKATGYKPNNSDIIYGPSNEMLWVWRNNLNNNTPYGCLQNCAAHCAYAIKGWPGFRTTVLNAVAN